MPGPGPGQTSTEAVLASQQKQLDRLARRPNRAGHTGFYRDRFLTADGAQTKALSYTPAAHSQHVYLNGVHLDESTDYTLSGFVVSLLSDAGALSGDLLDVRYAIDGDGALAGSIVDTFNRADTTDQALVAARSDGGLWTLDTDGTFEIDSDRLILSARTSTDVRASASYDDTGVVTITIVMGCDTFAADQFLHYRWADDGAGNCYGLSLYAAEQHFGLFREDSGSASTLAFQHFTEPDYAADGDHTLVIVYDRAAKHHHITWDGDVVIDHTDTVDKIGLNFSIAFTRTYSESPYFVNNVSVMPS